MDIESRMHEIVFLIDTSMAECTGKEHCNEILLTVYRLLSSFRQDASHGKKLFKFNKSSNNKCKTRDQTQNTSDVYLKWGCKFFNTSRTIARSRTCSSSFKNFKLTHLEDFEKKLVDVFSAEKEDTTKSKSKTVKTKRLLPPAELLSIALTETLHDFKWTAYDALTSPVRHRRSNSKSSETNFTNQTSFIRRNIFVFTKIPCSKKSLRHFSNKMVLDSDVFIDSIMSPALLHEYQQKMNISLNCVDFSSDGCSTSTASSFVQDIPTAEGLSIMKDAFRKLGGCFISKDAILCCVPTTNDCAQYSDSSLDPLQIFSNFPSEALLSRFQDIKQMSSQAEIHARLSCKSFQRLPVNLTPVVRNQDRGLKHFVNTAFQSFKPSLHTEVDGKSIEESIQQPVDFTDIHFTLLGCVPQAVVCDLATTFLSISFMLNCGEGSLVSSLFQQLTFSRNIGLLGMTTRGQPSLMLALLQAQNKDFGFISLLSLEATLKAEKALLQHYEARFINKEKLETQVIQGHFNKPSQLGLMERLHNDIQKLKSSVKKASPVLKSIEESQVFRSHCLNSWHVPGSTSQMTSLISKINDRLAVVNSKSEKKFLKQLQHHYMKERHPTEVVQSFQPPTSTPIYGFQQLSVGSSADSESGSRSSHDGLRSSTLSRGRLMVNKARSANFTTTEDENESFQSRPGSPERRRSSSAGLVDIGLTTEEDLKTYIHRQYDQALNAGVAMETTIQMLVRVTSQFMSNTQPKSPKKSAVNIINENIALSSLKLKEKYNNKGTEENKSNRVNEYKLQVMLLLEMESLLNNYDTDHCQLLNELVSMLRALSFLAGTTSLTSFLRDIVASYLATLPRLLVDIFDELMLPLPPALAKFASPATPSSLFDAQLSVTNNSLLSAPGSSQPSSHLSDQSSQHAKRFQKFKQHPSISDFRQKKQILVKPKLKVEVKKQVKDKIKTRSSSSRAGRGVDCERAKRNLFSDKIKPGNSKTKDKSRGCHKQRHSRSKTSRTLVPGTPVHKQTSQRHLWRQERHRQRENIQPEVQVIAESPVKDDDDDNNGNGDNSILNRPARYIVREAFYSSNTQPSRSLARSLELAQKGDGQGNCSQRYVNHSSKSQGTLASAVRGESPILSPKSRLLKTFLSSPSPTPKSKWKHKSSVISPKSKQRHKSSVTTPLRRSPRKSAKKLVFKDSDKKNNPYSSKPADTDYAHLIFDGENANDFDLLVSPPLGSSKKQFCGGWKTPEKQGTSQSFNSEAASCPPVLLYTSSTNPALNLSFRNILSSDRKDKLSKASAVNFCTGSSQDTSVRPSVNNNNTPSKQVLRSSVLSSPDRAPTVRVSSLSKSPVVNNSLLSFSGGETTVCLPFKQARKDAQNGIVLICTPTKGNKTSDSDQGKYVFTTPKKLASSHIHTTPSKVKFLESCLISPPTGSGYPPSLEKSTPGKSILKNSPVCKGKVKRRIELQSVSSSSLMKHTTFMNTNVEPNPSIPATSEETACSSSETELSSSTQLFGNTHEIGQICVHKPDSKSCTDKEYQNLDNKIPLNPHCRMTPSITVSHEVTLTNLHEFDSVFQNSKTKKINHKMDSSSSEDISYNSCLKKADLPAAVTICTPSSGSKPKADTINKWVRLKRSSPKNGTNSSSRLALSPACPSSGNDDKLKSSYTKAHFSCLESSDDKNVNEGLGIKKQSKKRSLLFEVDSSAVLSPSKKRKS